MRKFAEEGVYYIESPKVSIVFIYTLYVQCIYINTSETLGDSIYKSTNVHILAILFRSFGACSQRFSNYLAFQSFDYDRI